MNKHTRRSLRFPPDEGAVAWIDPNVDADSQSFKPTLAALVTDEALLGCGLITLEQSWLGQGTVVSVRVESLAPLKAQIRWVKALGDRVLKLGVVFLE